MKDSGDTYASTSLSLPSFLAAFPGRWHQIPMRVQLVCDVRVYALDIIPPCTKPQKSTPMKARTVLDSLPCPPRSPYLCIPPLQQVTPFQEGKNHGA